MTELKIMEVLLAWGRKKLAKIRITPWQNLSGGRMSQVASRAGQKIRSPTWDKSGYIIQGGWDLKDYDNRSLATTT